MDTQPPEAPEKVTFERGYPGAASQARRVRADLAEITAACPVADDLILMASECRAPTTAPEEARPQAESVIFTVGCGAAPDGCASHPRMFELQLETNAPSGGGGPALFYYLGSTHDLSNQYPFVRGQ